MKSPTLTGNPTSRRTEGSGRRSSVGHASPAEELGQCAALLLLAGDLPGEDVAVDVRVDGGEGPDATDVLSDLGSQWGQYEYVSNIGFGA